MEGSCMELALEGERLCKAGDCQSGVQFFEAAIQVGTDDLKTLSAIYSQLGNAYFYLLEYGKALEYHKHDLNLARTLGDKLGEAKASGNLGNTLKVLGKFDEATACCERHLNISKDLNDKVGEARALYNLGNVYHAIGKHAGKNANHDPGEFPQDVKDALQKAADYYEANLSIVKELGDRAAQGRACGNLGNTYYLLGNFSKAIGFHEERLAIAKEFGDKCAERRAYTNLGNAHIFLGEFEVAADHYKRTLQIASELGDRALEAQACFSLGNTYTLLRDFDTAIQFHMRHLKIAQQLNDRVGEGRAYWSLGNAHSSLGHHEQALSFASEHLAISKEIGDEMGMRTAQMNLADLRTMLGIKNGDDSDSLHNTSSISQESRMRRRSMEHLEIMKLTPDKCAKELNGGAKPKLAKGHQKLEKSVSADTYTSTNRETVEQSESQKPCQEKKKSEDMMDDDSFFDMLHKFQSRRIDDQRCSFRMLERGDSLEGANAVAAHSPHDEEFLDMVAGIQGSRMNDQRASLAQFPGLHNSQEVLETLLVNKKEESNVLDEQFFDMLMRCQGNRLEDQRSVLPAAALPAPTVPDEDFFSLIQRFQSNRLEEQRTSLPSSGSFKLSLRPGSNKDKKKKDKKDKENKK